MRIILILLLAFSCVRADSGSELRAALARLNGREPVRVRVDYQSIGREGDANKPAGGEPAATAIVEDGPEGLRIFWSRALMQTVGEEVAAQARDPDKRAPTRRAMDDLSATRLNGYLNAAPGLIQRLDEAQLVDEKTDTLEGRPVRVLTFKFTPHLNERSRKFVKEIEITGKLWVGADGVPVAAENRSRVKGRAYLVISFESSEAEEYRFRQAGDRLLVMRHVKENSGSGGGESSHQKTIANLVLDDTGSPPPAPDQLAARSK